MAAAPGTSRSAAAAQRVGATGCADRGRQRRRQRAAGALAPLSLLWRPHDHHRDLRTRLDAAISTDGPDQDRHLMSAIAGRQTRTPTTNAAAHRPATAAVDQSLELSAIPVARLRRPNLDRALARPNDASSYRRTNPAITTLAPNPTGSGTQIPIT